MQECTKYVVYGLLDKSQLDMKMQQIVKATCDTVQFKLQVIGPNWIVQDSLSRIVLLMKTNFEFSTLCGTVYKRGNLIFTPDGNTLLSPVGNQITIYDLVKNHTKTLPFENRKDIARLALSPTSSLLVSVDIDGRALLINYQKQVLLHRFNFKEKVFDIQFSPNGKLVAVTHGKIVQMWHSPGSTKEFAPFVLYKEYTGHYDTVLSISWSLDSKYFLTTSKDMTTRLFAVDVSNIDGDFNGACLTGHRDTVIGAWFSKDDTIFTISRDGALYEWALQGGEWTADINPSIPSKKRKGEKKELVSRWKASQKHYFSQNHAKVVSAAFHMSSGLLSVGFDSGIFGIWELPDFSNIQTLSISQNRISTVAVNSTGEWLAFGSSGLGQLLVWEWQSESYVLKQQGHQHNMTCLDYSLDGQYIATGGDDGKVKVWSAQTGFCFVTFTDHSGPVKALTFSKKKQVVFSASIDGTVRAYDLIRYRNFRTFTSPSQEQFSSLAVDSSGEIVCAASSDNFNVYVWSVLTGKLLEILTGHEAPISCLMFSPATGQLASGSWDQTIRIWEIFSRDSSCEVIECASDVLSLNYSPVGDTIASSLLNGNICLWETTYCKQIGVIEGRKDITGGRSSSDKMIVDKSGSGKYFNSLCFSSDGNSILAGGNSKYICLYDIASKSLLKKIQISVNLSLDRMQEQLSSKGIKDGIVMDQIDEDAELSDLEERIDKTLPGVRTGDASARSTKPEARTFSVKFSPTGLAFSAASTQGLLIYSCDDSIHFDPFDLDIEITPSSVLALLKDHNYSKALLSAFRLGEQAIIDKIFLGIPHVQIPLTILDISSKYFPKFLKTLIRLYETNNRVEVLLAWTTEFMKKNSNLLKLDLGVYRPLLRAIHKVMNEMFNDMSSLCGEDMYALEYLGTKFTKVVDTEMVVV